MKKLLLAAAAITTVGVAPQAHAQLLSGSGLGQVTGSVGSISRTTTGTLRSATRGTLRSEARTSGSQNVDRRSGEVSLDRSLDTGVAATTDQVLGTPLGAAGGSASGSGNASGSGSANAQLVGTDTVRGLAGQGVGRAREGVSTVRNLATPAVGAAQGQAGNLASQAGNLSAAGNANGSAAGSGSAGLANGMLAAAGSGAAAGDGAFAVAPGMPVLSPQGAPVGEVRQLVSDSRGRVEQVIVASQGREFAVPAANLAASGNALIVGEGSANGSTEQPPAEEAQPQADTPAE